MSAVLFDLDGTLIDSAPDLAGAANDMRAARGLNAMPLERFRAWVGTGARGMVARAFDAAPGDAGYEALKDEFLDRYQSRMTRHTVVFPDMAPLLDEFDRRGIRWGIVTNKATRFAAPLVDWLGLACRSGAVVCGDTTPHAKPHPAPLLEAASRLALEPSACAYVGDDRRDVQAGRAAGMITVAARWGYLGSDEPIEAWGADHIVDRPGDLLSCLGLT